MHPSIRIAAIADDLTGALETGVHFARGPDGAIVVTNLGAMPAGACGIVADTESRHLPEADAAAALRRAAVELNAGHADLLFKKTDSTLRGPIAAELAALVECNPGRSVLFAPGYPSLGRTVRGGVLHVFGVPVDCTEFGAERLNPVTESEVRSLLAPRLRLPMRVLRPDELVRTSEPTLTIVDSETDADVRAAARFLAAEPRDWIAAGTSLLAAQLAGELHWPPLRTVRPPANCMVINGSVHSRPLAQVADAAARGWPRVSPAEIRSSGCPPGWWILNTDQLEGEGIDRARRTGDAVLNILTNCPVEALCIFGGDTAFGIAQSLGQPVWIPMGEVMSAVPMSELAWSQQRLRIITKAGAFGPVDLLTRLRNAAGEGAHEH